MKGRAIVAIVLGLIVVLLAWNMFFYGPAGNEVDDAREARDTAQVERDELAEDVAALEALAANQPDFEVVRDKFNSMIPEQTDLAAFIVQANDIAEDSGLFWINIAPAEPTPGASGASEIAMTIQLEGGYYQVLDYLNQLEDLQRIVVIDAITVDASGAAEGEGEGGNVSLSGAPTLSVNLSARMFTQATFVARPTPTTVADPNATTTTGEATSTSAGGTN